MNITLVISALGCGGGERAIVLLAEGLANLEHRVTLITLDDKSTDFYQLSPKISRVELGIMSQSSNLLEAVGSNISRLTTLRKAIDATEPDVVISSLRITNVSVILALMGKKYPVIVTEQNDVKVFSYGPVWETLRRLTYHRSSMVVSVSKGVDQGLDLVPSSKRAIIYNPIKITDDQSVPTLPSEVDENKHWLACMGRLTDQKGHDLLLQAFQKIAPKHPDWQLLIVGRGELKEELLNLRDELGLAGQVIFTGALNNPFAVLKRAKIYVMASRSEGFPLAQGEALASGLPVISTDCPSGPREMIRHNVDGLLVENGDIEQIAAAMDSLMSDEPKRLKLAARAPEVIARFGQDKVVSDWETLINKLVEAKTK